MLGLLYPPSAYFIQHLLTQDPGARTTSRAAAGRRIHDSTVRVTATVLYAVCSGSLVWLWSLFTVLPCCDEVTYARPCGHAMGCSMYLVCGLGCGQWARRAAVGVCSDGALTQATTLSLSGERGRDQQKFAHSCCVLSVARTVTDKPPPPRLLCSEPWHVLCMLQTRQPEHESERISVPDLPCVLAACVPHARRAVNASAPPQPHWRRGRWTALARATYHPRASCAPSPCGPRSPCAPWRFAARRAPDSPLLAYLGEREGEGVGDGDV